MANSYEHLEVWQSGIALTSDVYRLTKKFPKDELFGLISQLRRAVVSIPTNIAEGSGRRAKKDFSRFVDFSIGPLNEVESLIFVSKNLSYISKNEFQEIDTKVKELGRKLGAFRKFLQK